MAVDEHADSLYRFIVKNIKDSEGASDIVQDSYERLWMNVARVEYSSVKAWLFSTAYNRMIDVIRKESRVVAEDEGFGTGLSHESGYSDIAEILNRAVERLPEQQRSAIMLRDYEGYSYREIAEITGMSEARVKINIYRARVALKSYIGTIESVI